MESTAGEAGRLTAGDEHTIDIESELLGTLSLNFSILVDNPTQYPSPTSSGINSVCCCGVEFFGEVVCAGRVSFKS